MAIIYIIENSIIYNPRTHTLRLSDSTQSTTLSVPTSLCLSLLIQQQGKIVSQYEFLFKVWGERGMSVTLNNLHQNIFLLRKSLNSFNNFKVTKSSIQTIPRRGFILSDELQITTQDEEFPFPVINTSKLTEYRYSNTRPTAEFHVESSIESIEEIIKNRQKDDKSLTWKKIIFWDWKYIAMAISVFLIIISKSNYLSYDDSLLDSYSQLPDIKDCTAYRNNDFRPDNFFLDIIKTKNITCVKGQHIYITNHDPAGSISIIVCHNPLDSGKNLFCISTYYVK